MSYTFIGTRRSRILEEKPKKRRPRGTAPKKERDSNLAPLRKVIGHIEVEAGVYGDRMLYFTHELFECFHHESQKSDIYGPTNAERRRCHRCLKEQQAHDALLVAQKKG